MSETASCLAIRSAVMCTTNVIATKDALTLNRSLAMPNIGMNMMNRARIGPGSRSINFSAVNSHMTIKNAMEVYTSQYRVKRSRNVHINAIRIVGSDIPKPRPRDSYTAR